MTRAVARDVSADGAPAAHRFGQRSLASAGLKLYGATCISSHARPQVTFQQDERLSFCRARQGDKTS